MTIYREPRLAASASLCRTFMNCAVVLALSSAMCCATDIGVRDGVERKATAPEAGTAAKGRKTEGPIETTADSVDYDKKSGWVTAVGKVLIKRGDQELRADFVKVNSITEDAEARGNVVLTQAGGTWKGSSLKYNFKTRRGNVPDLMGNVKPFTIQSGPTDIQPDSKGENEYVLRNAKITTCSNSLDDCHYHMRARTVSVVPGDHLEAKGVVVYMGFMPIMYVPYWYRNLEGDFGYRFYPGYSTLWGGYLLSSYRYRMSPVFRGETHVDYRSRRGVAFGQDFRWRDPEGIYQGDLLLYYLRDDNPWDDDDDPVLSGIEENRYRARFRDNYTLSAADNLLMQADYVSDRDMREDFFEREYRSSAVPDNYMSYVHRGDIYTMNFLVRSRLNDFYDGQNRLPEISVDFMRQPIGDSYFYYEGKTAGAFLEQVYDRNNTGAEEYSLFRADTAHTVYYPDKYFGFLNIIPRAGYRGTYYSKTKAVQVDTQQRVLVTTNEVVDASGRTNSTVTVVNQTNATETVIAGPSKWRSRTELGVEASFNAFKVFEVGDVMYRHVAQPYINYTLIPEPNVLPSELYQFDEIDTYTKEAWLRVGMRNKVQVKEERGPFNVVDVDVYTRLMFERPEGQGILDGLNVEGEVWPWEWMKIKFDGRYDTELSAVTTFNTRMEIHGVPGFRAGFENRFRKDESNLMLGDITISPNSNWDLNLFARYEAETSRVEEEGGYIQRNFDCMVWRVGTSILPGYTLDDGTEKEQELRFMLEMYLTAFPELGLSGRVY